MLNAILSIAGSSHQGHKRFSEISRGRQCSFMSFSALLCAQSFPVRHWDTATVDQILIGERMFLNALESQSIPDTDTLSLIYLPNQARLTVQSPSDCGNRTKSIARWGKKTAFWGKQFKTIARWGKHYYAYTLSFPCYHKLSSFFILRHYFHSMCNKMSRNKIDILNISHHLCYRYFYFYNSLRSTWLAISNF